MSGEDGGSDSDSDGSHPNRNQVEDQNNDEFTQVAKKVRKSEI